ncbi:MAG TPA: hypothetical protein VGI26_00290 [Solirubrobacteraceae bacterium]
MRILFVCLGNICRSPTAEGVMRKLVTEAGLQDSIELDSAGIGGWHIGASLGPVLHLPVPWTAVCRMRGCASLHD